MSYHISRDDYIDLILWVLKQRGGHGEVHEVINEIEPLVAPYLTEWDYQPINTPPFELRWRNAVRWARDAAVKRGLLLPPADSGRGVWSISGLGQRYVPVSAPRSLPGGLGSGERVWHRSTRSTDYPHPPSNIAGQLKIFAVVMDSALSAQPGTSANPAMGQLITTLERLLTSPSPRPVNAKQAKTSRKTQKSSWQLLSPTQRSASIRTGAQGANILDASRLDSFLQHSWSPNMKGWLKVKKPLKVEQWQRLDLIAALPGCVALVAVKKQWIPLHTALTLSMQAVHMVLGAPQYQKRHLWSLLEHCQPGQREPVLSLLQQGLLHRMLSAWLLELLRNQEHNQDGLLILQITCLRGWIDDIREITGSPERWVSDETISDKWLDILNFPADDASIPAPDEMEIRIRALVIWLSKQNPQERPSSLRGHQVDDLFWSHALGWGVSCGKQPARPESRLPIHVISAARRIEKCCPIVSHEAIFSQPWVNLSALCEAKFVSDHWSEVISDLRDLACQTIKDSSMSA